eukprot:TRINITY_DN1861_c0_g1_i1.p1 TRINITY_DN1861_c0_g1~~TRINITY_DN1861_c0_g1_i1.p1  ORF type:complete len:885 (+),score=348.60 TRINITY_DN1861_c0_g1_i1:322-2976(+)
MVLPSCAGIQSLTVILSASLVLITGVLIGAITFTSGISLVEKARETGDQGVDQCLKSGEHDLTEIAGRYLKSVVGKTEEKVDHYLEAPEKAVLELAALASKYHPDTSTSPEFISDTLRPNMYSRLSVLVGQGTSMIAYFPFPWSPSHPATVDSYQTSSRGGDLSFFYANGGTGNVFPETGWGPVHVIEQRLANRSLGYNHTTVETGEADELGYAAHRDTPCKNYTDWTAGEHTGHCVLPIQFIQSANWLEMQGRAKWNVLNPKGVLDEPNKVHFSPVMAHRFFLISFVTVTFVHPEMYNINGRQQNRVGTFMAALQGEGLAELFKKQSLPQGSLLYCVDSDHWTGKVGTLLAFNAGRFANYIRVNLPGGTRPYDVLRTLHITNHTMQAGDATPSVIAEHGRFVFTLPNDYTSMVEKTKSTFYPWRSKNGTLYWTITTEVGRGDLRFYISLLVPRSAVMDAIDASRGFILAKTDQDRRDSDEQQQRMLFMTLGITGAVVVMLLLLAVVFARLITAPLARLASDMANVAVMNLEDVEIDQTLSKLGEVKDMQQSFRQMVRNLMEYRNYMPQSVLVKDTDDESDVTIHTANDRSAKYEPEGSSIFGGVTPTSPTVVTCSTRHNKAIIDHHILKKKAVSVLAFNLKSWHAHITGVDPGEVIDKHAEILNVLLQSVQTSKGVCDTFSGDRLMATFNAYTVLSSHRLAGVQAAHNARGRLANVKDAPQLSLAVSTGEAKVGHMGCNGMKKVSIISNVIPWVVALERYNNMAGHTGVLDQWVARDMRGCFDLKVVDKLHYPKRSASDIRIYELCNARTAKEEAEWMYQIESIEATSVYLNWNKAFEAILEDEWEAAEAVINSVPAESQEEMKRLRAYILQRQYTPVDIQFH